MDAKQIKKYTAEEFFTATANDDGRYELHNGEIVAQAAPSIKHQTIVGKLFSAFDNYITSKNGKCKPFIAPCDVVLDENNVVQPDFFVICDDRKYDDKRCYGAPDFIIEVTSGNRFNDYVVKLHSYLDAHVREYWIIDPDYERILVYDFESNDTSRIYTFDMTVPVGIYNGELTVNLRELLGEK